MMFFFMVVVVAVITVDCYLASVDCWISVGELRCVGTLSALCPCGCTSLAHYPEQEWLNRLTESAPSSVTA